MSNSWRWRSALCAVFLNGVVLTSTGAFAGDTQFADEAVTLCAAWLISPDKFDDVLLKQGYSAGTASPAGDSWKINTYHKRPVRKLSTAEIPNWTAKTKMCTFNTTEAFAGDELGAFAAVLAKNTDLGPFEARLVTQQLGSASQRVALLRQKVSVTPINVAILSTASMTQFTFTRVDYNKAN